MINDFFCHSWGNSAVIFMSDKVTSENYCRIALQKSLFTLTNILSYFLHAILCHEHTYPLKTITNLSFRQGRFSWVMKSREKIRLPYHLMSDKEIIIHNDDYIILFFTCSFMSWTHKSAKNYLPLLISPLSARMVFSDLALWRHHSWSVTSHQCEMLVLRRHIRRLSLHAQIGAKAIFTSE